MKDLIASIARFIPEYIDNILHLALRPYITGTRLVRDSDLTSACIYFFISVLLTQLVRFRVFSDVSQIEKIGAIDLGWKIIGAFLVVGYLWAIASISREPDLTRLVIFVAFGFGTLSIIFQSALILSAGFWNFTDEAFHGCFQAASQYGATIVESEKCRELATKYPQMTDPTTLTITALFLAVLFIVVLIWFVQNIRVYAHVFLGETRRKLAVLVLLLTAPLVLYVIFNVRSSFLADAMK